MKRQIALLICLLLVFSTLAGCNGGDVAETSAQTPTAASQETETPEERSLLPLCDELTEFTMFYTMNIQAMNHIETPNDSPAWQELERLTNVHIEFQIVTAQTMTEQFGIMSAADNYTDFLSSLSNKYSGGLSKAVEDEVIVDLAGYIDEYMPNYKAVRESDEAYIKGNTLEGGVIGETASFNMEGLAPDLGPVVRADWLGELGMERPETYDELYEVLKAFKTEFGADAALWLAPFGSTIGNYYSAGYGVASANFMSMFNGFIQIDGEVRYSPLEPGYREYLEIMNKWYEEGLVYGDYMTGSASFMAPDDELIVNGHTGVAVLPRAALGTYAVKSGNPDLQFVGISAPVVNKGDVTHIMLETPMVSGDGVSVSAACPDIELACRWLDFGYTEEGFLLNNYGVQGLSWDYNAAGDPEFTELIYNNPNEIDFETSAWIYTMVKGPFLVDWTKNLVSYSDAQIEAGELWTKGDQAYVYPSAAVMNTDESNEFSVLYADLGTYVSEMTNRFITGQESFEDYEKFVEQIKVLEIDRMLELKQAALNRYNNA